jgi:hypothetical protein
MQANAGLNPWEDIGMAKEFKDMAVQDILHALENIDYADTETTICALLAVFELNVLKQKLAEAKDKYGFNYGSCITELTYNARSHEESIQDLSNFEGTVDEYVCMRIIERMRKSVADGTPGKKFVSESVTNLLLNEIRSMEQKSLEKEDFRKRLRKSNGIIDQ